MDRDPNGEPGLSPAERRLVELLALLRADGPPADPHFVPLVLRRARSQRTLRSLLDLIGLLARSVPDALLLARGDRSRSRARE
jgi:hypothetical protein